MGLNLGLSAQQAKRLLRTDERERVHAITPLQQAAAPAKQAAEALFRVTLLFPKEAYSRSTARNVLSASAYSGHASTCGICPMPGSATKVEPLIAAAALAPSAG